MAASAVVYRLERQYIEASKNKKLGPRAREELRADWQLYKYTHFWTLADWQAIRTPKYWQTMELLDKKLERKLYLLKCVMYYNDKKYPDRI